MLTASTLASINRAARSTIRRAMVEIMMEAAGPLKQYENKHRGNSGSAVGGDSYQGAGAGTLLAEGQDKGWDDASVLRDVPNNPAKCIMWCAIALGALMRGSPVKNVSRRQARAKGPIACCSTALSVVSFPVPRGLREVPTARGCSLIFWSGYLLSILHLHGVLQFWHEGLHIVERRKVLGCVCQERANRPSMVAFQSGQKPAVLVFDSMFEAFYHPQICFLISLCR